jgi:hypothetical protein
MTVSRRDQLIVAVSIALGLTWFFWPKSEHGASPVSEKEAAPRAAGKGNTGPRSLADIPPLDDLKVERGELGGDVGRNVFRFYDAPTPVPPTPVPTMTPVPAAGSRSFIGPMPPSPTPTQTPIIPPPIPYKGVGLFGPRERMIAALEDGGRLISAREGDVLDGRFILQKINRESIDFAFVGLPPEITRRIPIAGAGSGAGK